MVLSIWERIKGFLVSPSKTFDASKEDTVGDAFKYFIVILAIYAVIVTIIVAVALPQILNFLATSLPPGTLPPEALMLGAGGGAVFAVTSFIQAFIGGIISVFIIGLWTHIWVYLVGGRKGVEQTIKTLMYAMTPHYLFVWIPVVNVIWALIVGAIGIRQLHELSTGKAVLAVIIAIAIPIIIGIAIIAAFVAVVIQSGFSGPTGTGFGGY